MILAAGRFLGPSDLAVYGLFMSLFSFFSMIVYFNTDSFLLRTFKLSTDVESASLYNDIFSFMFFFKFENYETLYYQTLKNLTTYTFYFRKNFAQEEFGLMLD